MKNKNLRNALVAVATVAAAVVLSSPPPPARMLIPLYIAPGTNGVRWEPVMSTGYSSSIDVILNPKNGAGSAMDNNYKVGISRLRSAGMGVYGYIYTGYGTRDMAIVKSEVDKWLNWYAPITGIFVDEAEYRSNQPDIPYYAELYNYISAKGLKVVNNPGTMTTEGYINTADTTCIFESAAPNSFSMPLWTWNYPSSKFCFLAYGASVEQMRTLVDTARRNNIGYVYITNVSVGDYWASLPSYLVEEASLLGDSPTVTPTKTPVISTPIITATKTITPTLTPVPVTPKSEVCFTLAPTVTIDGIGRGQVCFK